MAADLPPVGPVIQESCRYHMKISRLMAMDDKPILPRWYKDGLRFACVQCGNCCRGSPDRESRVWVTPDEAGTIAAHLGMSLNGFGSRYLRKINNRFAVIDQPNGDCSFWQVGVGCKIYPVRPIQCRTYPFWRKHLSSQETWQVVTQECPGIGEGPLHLTTDIDAQQTGDSESRRVNPLNVLP